MTTTSNRISITPDIMALLTSPVEIWLFLVMLREADEDGVVKVKTSALAEKNNIGRQALRRALQKIIATNLATILTTKIGRNGYSLLRVYNGESYNVDLSGETIAENQFNGQIQEKEQRKDKENFPPHPLYKEKENKKEKEFKQKKEKKESNDFGLVSAICTESEVKKIKDDERLLKELLDEKISIEAFCMRERIPIDDFCRMAEDALNIFRLKGILFSNNAHKRSALMNAVQRKIIEQRRNNRQNVNTKTIRADNEQRQYEIRQRIIEKLESAGCKNVAARKSDD